MPCKRCTHCGVNGHTVEECWLKKLGDTELKLEAERRKAWEKKYGRKYVVGGDNTGTV